jgi:hypothetical protein
VCQRSNGYTTPTIDCNATVQRCSARLRAQKSEQRQKAHRTVNSACMVAQKSEAPTVGTQRLGDVAGAPDSVRCTTRQKPSPTVLLMVGAINTPQPPHFNASKFSAFKPHTRDLDFIRRHKQEIKSSPKSKDHSNQIVTRERETFVFI